MKNLITNPFITTGYVSPQYFCNRESETNIVMKSIASRRNLTLISLRRIGKTGLLKHVKHHFENRKEKTTVIYADLMPTMNANDLLNVLSTALIAARKNEKNIFEKISTVLASLRPKLSFDSLTGQPTVELRVESGSDIQFGMVHLMKFISEIKNDLIFMFDEFQQIGYYPEENIEQTLRAVIQSYPEIAFIFSGSSKHMLEPMFTVASRPFYQSTQLMYLDKIGHDDYRVFITEKFLAENKNIGEGVIESIFKWTRLHTYYVQYVCNLLFEETISQADSDLVKKVFHRILTDYDPLYNNYRTLIPQHQFRLLQAIASEDGVTQPTSGEFIRNHNLTSSSSVRTSLKALSEKELIVLENDKWIVYDVFFSRWLAYNFS